MTLLWNTMVLLRKSFEPLFRVFLYLVVVLPSGTVFGVNVKMICFLLLFAPAILCLVENSKMTLLHLGLLLAIPAFFSLWIVISQYYGGQLGLALSEYKDIMITFVTSWVAAVFFMEDQDAKIKFLRMVIHAEVVMCVLKGLLLVYAAYTGIAVSALVSEINLFFGVNLMGMDFGSALGRIQFTSDALIPLCIYVLLRYRRNLKIGTVGALVMFALMTLSLVLTFSRYYWFFAAITLLLGLLGKRDRFHAVLITSLGLAFALSFPLLLGLAQLRFSADVAGGSDDIRTEEYSALRRSFLEAPLFGHGYGSYSSEVIRSPELPYVYEIQLYALAGQEGIVGLIAMAMVILYYFHELWSWGGAGQLRNFVPKASLLCLLLLWLAGGLLNPMLLNSAAAISYAVIKALAGLSNDRPREMIDGETGRQRLNLAVLPQSG